MKRKIVALFVLITLLFTGCELSSGENIIIEKSSFKENAALVYWKSFPFLKTQMGFINTEGKVYCTLPEGYQYRGNDGGYSLDGYFFGNGTSEQTKGQFILGQMDGTITYQSPENKNYIVRAGGNGAFLVENPVRNITTSHSVYGLIDANGNWIIEPNVVGKTIENAEVSYAYHGEGIFSVDYTGYKVGSGYNYHILFSSTTGSVTEIENVTISSDFINGIAIGSVGTYGDCCLIRSNGTIEDFSVDTTHWMNTYGENLLFIWDSYDQKGHFFVYDVNGNVLLDSSQIYPEYTFWRSNFSAYGGYTFQDGYAAVLIAGADGKTYLTAISKETMRFSFEPICVTLIYPYICNNSALVRLADKELALIQLTDGSIKELNIPLELAFNKDSGDFVDTRKYGFLFDKVIVDNDSSNAELYNWDGDAIPISK